MSANHSPQAIDTAHRDSAFAVCVFCGSRAGANPAHAALAAKLGAHLAAQQMTLIYGGGSIGLMGILSRAVMAAGGTAIGVIPHFLERMEVAQSGLSQLIRVDSMHERKARMADLADCFLALPGGTGTLDELIEITTWAQLGLHHKPIFLLGPQDYWAPLAGLIDHMVREGFVSPQTRALMRPLPDLDAAMAALADARRHADIVRAGAGAR